MKINLKEAVRQAQPYHQTLLLTQRLPAHIEPPCTIEADYQVEWRGSYYLLKLHTSGLLRICCQRCLNEAEVNYSNEVELAICLSEQQAESVLADYEAIVAVEQQIDLEEIVTDELHLYAPSMHPDENDCQF